MSSTYDSSSVQLTFGTACPTCGGGGFWCDRCEGRGEIEVTDDMIVKTEWIPVRIGEPIAIADLGPPPVPPYSLLDAIEETIEELDDTQPCVPVLPDTGRVDTLAQHIRDLDELIPGSSRAEELRAVRFDLTCEYFDLTGKLI